MVHLIEQNGDQPTMFTKKPYFFISLGTITPVSATGKLIGGFCALFGVFTITLPVPILVNSFSAFYKNKLWRGEVAMRRRDRLVQAGLPGSGTGNPGNDGNGTMANSTGKDANLLFELNGVQ